MLRELEDAGERRRRGAVQRAGRRHGAAAGRTSASSSACRPPGPSPTAPCAPAAASRCCSPQEGWRPLRLAPAAADRRSASSRSWPASRPGGLPQLGPSLRALLAGPRTRARLRSLTLVVLCVDAAPGARRRRPARRGAAGLRRARRRCCRRRRPSDEQRRALAAAGVRVVTSREGDDLGAGARGAGPRRGGRSPCERGGPRHSRPAPRDARTRRACGRAAGARTPPSYFASFAALGASRRPRARRASRSRASRRVLLAAAVTAAFAGAPGLVRRRAWPLALVLLPLGAYLLVRVQVRRPAGRARPRRPRRRPAGPAAVGRAHVRRTSGSRSTHRPGDGLAVLLSLVVYAVVGLAAFLALSLRLALPAVAVLLVALGFALTTDNADRLVLGAARLPRARRVHARAVALPAPRAVARHRRRWRGRSRPRWPPCSPSPCWAPPRSRRARRCGTGRGGASRAPATPTWASTGCRATCGCSRSRPMRRRCACTRRSPRTGGPTPSRPSTGATWFNGSSYQELAAGTRAGAADLHGPVRGRRNPAGGWSPQSFEVVSTYTDHLFTGGTPRTVTLDAPGTRPVGHRRAGPAAQPAARADAAVRG